MKDIIEKVRATPKGEIVLITTDDLHSLVEHIEKLEAMLANVQVVEGEVDSSEFVIENHAGKWREVIPVPGRTVTDSLLETYEALKESQP